MGGVLSWAVELKQFGFGDGFEVSLRSGAGPERGESERRADDGAPAPVEPTGNRVASSHAILVGNGDVPVGDSDKLGHGGSDEDQGRLGSDFVLSFRRDANLWRFTAGSRARLCGLKDKIVPDQPGAERQMFWVACVESKVDGKHYVVVGSVPGLLTEHFFVAKVTRPAALSHVGFSYLPDPGRAAFGNQEEPAPVIVESITAFPHGLTGELPFVSLRFVDLQERSTRASTPTSDALMAADVPSVAGAESGGSGLELRVLRSVLPPAEGSTSRCSTWPDAARRECGLPVAKLSSSEARLEKRARLRVTPPVIAPNSYEAPISWEPRAAEQPKFGPFDDVLRHDPKNWDPYL